MTEALPIFPLGTVLVPGLLLPLHIFEERYRLLVRELVDLPEDEPRRFGVVAIRQGREVGPDNAESLYEVGCTAELRRVEEHEDGRFGLLTTGGTRFRLASVDRTSRPYLLGEVEYLDEPVGDPAEVATLVPSVADLLRVYLTRLGAARQVEIDTSEVPDDPLLLSYLVAVTVANETADRQALLAAPDAAARLRAGRALLTRESGLLRRLDAVAAADLTRGPISPN